MVKKHSSGKMLKTGRLAEKSCAGRRQPVKHGTETVSKGRSKGAFVLYSPEPVAKDTAKPNDAVKVTTWKGQRYVDSIRRQSLDDEIINRQDSEVMTQIQLQDEQLKGGQTSSIVIPTSNFEEDEDRSLDFPEVSTPFNKRLVSSTPDPEKLLEPELLEQYQCTTDHQSVHKQPSRISPQMIPERDTAKPVLLSVASGLSDKIKQQRQLYQQHQEFLQQLKVSEKLSHLQQCQQWQHCLQQYCQNTSCSQEQIAAAKKQGNLSFPVALENQESVAYIQLSHMPTVAKAEWLEDDLQNSVSKKTTVANSLKHVSDATSSVSAYSRFHVISSLPGIVTIPGTENSLSKRTSTTAPPAAISGGKLSPNARTLSHSAATSGMLSSKKVHSSSNTPHPKAVRDQNCHLPCSKQSLVYSNMSSGKINSNSEVGSNFEECEKPNKKVEEGSKSQSSKVNKSTNVKMTGNLLAVKSRATVEPDRLQTSKKLSLQVQTEKVQETLGDKSSERGNEIIPALPSSAAVHKQEQISAVKKSRLDNIVEGHLNASADTCDMEVIDVISHFGHDTGKIDFKILEKSLERAEDELSHVGCRESPASDTNDLSQVIKFLKTSAFNDVKAAHLVKCEDSVISDNDTLVEEAHSMNEAATSNTAKEKSDCALIELIHQYLPQPDRSEVNINNNNSCRELSYDKPEVNKYSTGKDELAKPEMNVNKSRRDNGQAGTDPLARSHYHIGEVVALNHNAEINVNQNQYDEDEDVDNYTVRSQTRAHKNLHYLQKMANPILRDIACKLTFKATALRDTELRNLIDDMFFHVDAALAHEEARFQSLQMFFAEENSKLKKRLEMVNKLAATEREERMGSRVSNSEVLHLEKKILYLKQEKERLDIQVTNLLEEKAGWLITQQNLVKTISLKNHELVKLEEKNHTEKKALMQSLDQATKNSQGVHYKLSIADREIANLEQRLKCNDLDLGDLREKLKATEARLRQCENHSTEKDEEVMRLQDLVDTLKIGVDHVLKAYEVAANGQASTAEQRQGMENLRLMVHPEQYRVRAQGAQVHHGRPASQYKSQPGAGNEKGPSYANDHYGQLTAAALEEHNRRLSPVDFSLWRSLDDGPVTALPEGQEPYHSDSEIEVIGRGSRQKSSQKYKNGSVRDSRLLMRHGPAAGIDKENRRWQTQEEISTGGKKKKRRRNSESDKYYYEARKEDEIVTRGRAEAMEEPLVQSWIEVNMEDDNNVDSVKAKCNYLQEDPSDLDRLPRKSVKNIDDFHADSPGTNYSTLRSVTLSRSNGEHERTRDRKTSQETYYSTLRSEPLSQHNHHFSSRDERLDKTSTFAPHRDPYYSLHLQQGHLAGISKHKTSRLTSDPQFVNFKTDHPSVPRKIHEDQNIGHKSLHYVSGRRTEYKNHPHVQHQEQNPMHYNSFDELELSKCREPDRFVRSQYMRSEERCLAHDAMKTSEENPTYLTGSKFTNEGSSMPTHSSPVSLSASRRATRGSNHENGPQREFFRGTEMSASLSSIAETDTGQHNCSQLNSLNEDPFSSGIATLDAKIAMLQKKINRTKAIFS